jgi:dTDP-4-amino-4,6-dideoxygalactose transaminase
MTKTSYERATGRASSYDVVQYGFNYRATEITAAIASIQLEKLDRNNAQRRKLVARYRQHLLDHPLLTIPFAPRLEDSAHHVMPVVLSDASLRDPLREALEKDGVQTTVHYPPAHRFTHIRAVVKEMPELPMTDDIVDRELTLPLHPLLSESDIDEICGRLKRCLDAVAAVGNGARSAGGFSSAEEYGSERNA